MISTKSKYISTYSASPGKARLRGTEYEENNLGISARKIWGKLPNIVTNTPHSTCIIKLCNT